MIASMTKAKNSEPDPRGLGILLLAAGRDWGTFWRMWMLILADRLAVPSVAVALLVAFAGPF